MMGFCEVRVEFESMSIIRDCALVRPPVCAGPKQIPARHVSFGQVGIQSKSLSHRSTGLLNPLWVIYLYAEPPSSIGCGQRSICGGKLRIHLDGSLKKPNGLIIGLSCFQTVIRLSP